ncbi:glutathione S-transferase [Halioglobus japonicus]|uniref:Glutathione S-transferase family protein n=2 Tax=Halioglobus TaxID=1217416 RepID=A0AAP8MH04_9GAMM|nr:glutathione S-transferase family protein [Halioglobus japonicus]AQA19295.1 glutathione S-transferase [Halioglobus japonicus]PLW87666.1 glutathione S-transferase family protein [Halioglobus japonicus]GHD07223.1 glutathione S-transferase [Halioglobus japonicus]
MIKIYGVHGSPFVRKVFIALDYKDIPYEIVAQMPFSGDQDYLKINPTGKIPALVDGDLTIGDSKVICQHLENAYPERPLYPEDVADKARAHWYEDFCGGQVAELAAGIFFQRFMRPLAFKQDPDEELIAKITEKKLPPVLDYLESIVPAEGFVFGEFMMADLCIASPFFNAGYAGYEVDAEKWPNVAGLIARVREQPHVKAVLEKEAKALGLAAA